MGAGEEGGGRGRGRTPAEPVYAPPSDLFLSCGLYAPGPGDEAPRSVSSRCIITRSELEPKPCSPFFALRLGLALRSTRSATLALLGCTGLYLPGSLWCWYILSHSRLVLEADHSDE